MLLHPGHLRNYYNCNEQTDYVLCWFMQAMAEQSREIEVHKDMLKAQTETERRTVRYIPSLWWQQSPE